MPGSASLSLADAAIEMEFVVTTEGRNLEDKMATSVGWNEASINRLRSAGEETLSSLLSQDEESEEDAGKRLIVAARRADAAIEMEFVVTTEGRNLEDKWPI